MRKIVDSKIMKKIDTESQSIFGYPSAVLMENAGIKSWNIFRQYLQPGKVNRLLVFAGKGNNGGDALVIARQAFLEGYDVRIITASEELKGDAEINRKIIQALTIPVEVWSSNEKAEVFFPEAEWVIDGISGTGITGALRGSLGEMAKWINKSGLPVCSVDVPSGVGDDYESSFPAVKARLTLTMGLPKRSILLPAARLLCGEIITVNLGFPPELIKDPDIPGELWEWEDLSLLIGNMPRETYKTKRGTVGIFCGGRGTAGAAHLSAESAARSRCGMVFLYVPEQIYGAVASKISSVLVYPADFSKLNSEVFSQYNALLAGPGLGTGKIIEELILKLLSEDYTGVLDADGINVLAELTGRKKRVSLKNRWILTPHPGEFSRLSGRPVSEVLNDPLPLLFKVSQKLEAVIALKGHITWIVSPDGMYRVVDGMEPSLATAGSGDVLSGIISGLLASGLGPLDAATAGVLLHKEAGKTAYGDLGWYLSEDLFPYISRLTAFIGKKEGA
jgi:ADP-dependent NAD(P)H-hydrate dehydratase / NAD(P)H-hydrate epimerase